MNPVQFKRNKSQSLQNDNIIDSHVEEIVPGQHRFRTILGFTTLIFIVASFVFSNGSRNSLATVKERISYNVNAGDKFLQNAQDPQITPKDFDVKDLNGGESRMLIWSFNGESNGQVQVFVNGQSVHEPFVLSDKPVALQVPVPSVVTIKHVNGKVSYAVKFPDRKMTIFNFAPPLAANSYTLTPKL